MGKHAIERPVLYPVQVVIKDGACIDVYGIYNEAQFESFIDEERAAYVDARGVSEFIGELFHRAHQRGGQWSSRFGQVIYRVEYALTVL